MSTPVDEPSSPHFDEKQWGPTDMPAPRNTSPYLYQQENQHPPHPDRSSDEDNTVFGDTSAANSRLNAFPSFDDSATMEKPPTSQQREPPVNKRLRLQTSTAQFAPSIQSMKSPSQTREEAHRLEDDLRMLQIEQQVSAANAEKEREREGEGGDGSMLEKTTTRNSVRRERSRRDDVDEFDIQTQPVHETTKLYRPPKRPTTALSKFVKMLHHRSFLIRYFTYITPVVLIILVPLLVGALLPAAEGANVGGVSLLWFSIWLEIVWLTLWAGRLLAKALPWPIGLISSLFTDNSKKWRDMIKQLEIAATLFFWWLGIEVSFLPTMKNHHVDGDKTTRHWEDIVNKIIVAFFVCAILNFAEKIIIQLIAISFHERTYADRIELNKFQIGSLTKLYAYSKDKLIQADSDFEHVEPASGARTPGQYLSRAQRQTVQVFNRFGDVAGKVAGDFTGRAIKRSSHPSMVILALLNSTSGSQTLARRLYRTFMREDTETVHQEDLQHAFDNDEEADAAFTMFDKDMNGDISMEELEAVCVEIGRERKAITASLKDLDSVVGKLDDCLLFVVILISILVLISLISTSAAGVLTSAGSTVLALSWLLQATAQEFLQSLIFVFVKHPFDVGDRITVYGNTGSTLKGDDYFVKEISLLYTEFKKMEGHVVQAPNSYLNTLFILNQRRSGGLAEAVPITWKFGTTLEQIDGVRQKLLEFVKMEKREYQPNILTELRDVVEAHSISLNIVFFFKSNWQNEGLRLQRRNKFICALMIAMQEMGIEGPNMRFPGQRESFPLYMQSIPFSVERAGRGGHPDNPAGLGPLPSYQEAYQEASAPAPQYDGGIDGPIPEETEESSLVSPQDYQSALPAATTAEQLQGSALDRVRSPSGATTSASIQNPASAAHLRRRGPSILDTSGRGRAETGRNRGESIVRKGRQESIAQISRRMDLSLGLEGHVSANMAGDVFEDRDRARLHLPAHINVTSPSTSRPRGASPSATSNRRVSRGSLASARSGDTAAGGQQRRGLLPFGPGLLNRVGTDGPRGSFVHRNRFFSTTRKSHDTERQNPMGMQFGQDLRNMESGLAGIQEVPTPGFGTPNAGKRLGYPAGAGGSLDQGRAAYAANSQGTGHIDPRTGFISPAAVKLDSNDAEAASIAPETTPDGRPLFHAAQLGSQDGIATAISRANLAGTDGHDHQATAAGIVAGSRIVADLQARGRSRGMTNDTVGTSIDPLHVVGQPQQNVIQQEAQPSAGSGPAGANLEPAVTSLSQAETEHIVTPAVERDAGDVQPPPPAHVA